ncbi:MAG: D-alanine--D-alanine ligase [Clostridia bacterium]|nr:D-alanine--D-alanine ligase [Clostridia bacterium]
MKTRVAVIFGGHSVEHEVSIISGLQACGALDTEKYEAFPLYISKDNRFYVGENLRQIASFRDMKTCLAEATRVLLVPGEQGVELVRYPMKKFGNNVVGGFDVAVPVVHGTNVEDGTLMGYLEMLGVPYASCDVTSSALGMDKYAMKAALRQAGVPVLDAKLYSGKEYAVDSDRVLDEIETVIGYPVIVKPVNLGSSVGISKAKDRASLTDAMDLAVSFADRVLVERAVPNLREINCAVLGDYETARPSACEEPLNAEDILTFGDKYLSGDGGKSGGSKGMTDLKRRCPAELPEGMTEQVQELAVRTFKALGCLGVARIDFLNDKETGELWVNEINTIPGSLSFYLWQEVGVSFSALMDELVQLAFKRQREREALTFTYESNILSGTTFGAKGSKGKA